MDKRLKISKLDAARRQLELAIELYFLRRDPVSIHTLVGAVYTILKDLNKHRGGKPMLLESVVTEYVIPGKENEVLNKLYEAENFFKHADRDPETTVDFNPDANDLVLWESCMKYNEMTGEQSRIMQCMNLWFQIQNPDLFRYEDWKKKKLVSGQNIVNSLGREGFLRQFMLLKLKG